MSWGKAHRLTAVAGVTLASVSGLGAGAWAFTHRRHDGPIVPRYATAREMAQRAGCAASFRPLPAPAGVQSAGACTVAAHAVRFRVQRLIETADPWPAAPGARRAPNYVGNGWIVHARDVATLDAVGARLAS